MMYGKKTSSKKMSKTAKKGKDMKDTKSITGILKSGGGKVTL